MQPAVAGARSALSPASIDWVCVPFDALGVDGLYALLGQRQQVFCVEQQCAYLDVDGADPACWHVLGRDAGGTLMASLRIVPPGLKYAEASIGRVVTAPASRGGGLGVELMTRGIAHAERLHPRAAIRIGAQAHLQRFYGRFGFVAEGAEYLEDNIPHIEMVRAAAKAFNASEQS